MFGGTGPGFLRSSSFGGQNLSEVSGAQNTNEEPQRISPIVWREIYDVDEDIMLEDTPKEMISKKDVNRSSARR